MTENIGSSEPLHLPPIVRHDLLGNCYQNPDGSLIPMKSCKCRNGTHSSACPIYAHSVKAPLEPCTPEQLDRYRGMICRQAKRASPPPRLNLPSILPSSPPRLPLLFFLLSLLPLPTLHAQTASFQSKHFDVTVTNGSSSDAKAFALQADYYRQAIASNLTSHFPDAGSIPSWRQRWPVSITLTTSEGGGETVFENPGLGIIPITANWSGSRQALLDDVIPHEVFHCVIHTLLPNSIPRWLDEGLAQCWESESAQTRSHNRTLTALTTSPLPTIPFNTLLSTNPSYPVTSDKLFIFYNQSHSLLTYLLSEQLPSPTYPDDTPDQLILRLLAGLSSTPNLTIDHQNQLLQELWGVTPSSLQISWLETIRQSQTNSQTVSFRPFSRWFPYAHARRQQPFICQNGVCVPATPIRIVPANPSRQPSGLPFDPTDQARAPSYPVNPAPQIIDPAETTPPSPPLTNPSSSSPGDTGVRGEEMLALQSSISNLQSQTELLQAQNQKLQDQLSELILRKFRVNLIKGGKTIRSVQVSPISGNGLLELDFDKIDQPTGPAK